jgi:hypothetical protein
MGRATPYLLISLIAAKPTGDGQRDTATFVAQDFKPSQNSGTHGREITTALAYKFVPSEMWVAVPVDLDFHHWPLPPW